MKPLTDLPNIGTTPSKKLNEIGVKTEYDLKQMGSENAIVKLSVIENSGACINMLYALEGAIQGIRWHDLNRQRMNELNDFYKALVKRNENVK